MPIIHSPNLFDELGKPDSPHVKAALAGECCVCGSPPGEFCAPPIADNRLVHLDRTYP
ncbi:hypothetical protein [Mycobacterium sp. 1245499.0]|uniref:hypothetical protein n=1 Tax=Mycobacterium sp. 1245499.0 TaxID=1834074 RepID=UPI000A9621E7|nr:hypothetical protein [Mycobacterium sp. 1245499.0]